MAATLPGQGMAQYQHPGQPAPGTAPQGMAPPSGQFMPPPGVQYQGPPQGGAMPPGAPPAGQNQQPPQQSEAQLISFD